MSYETYEVAVVKRGLICNRCRRKYEEHRAGGTERYLEGATEKGWRVTTTITRNGVPSREDMDYCPECVVAIFAEYAKGAATLANPNDLR